MFIGEKNYYWRCLEFVFGCDIITFIMGVVTFILNLVYSHYEELKSGYHLAIASVNPYLLKKKE